MVALSSIGFLAPWLLAGLLALPVLWWLLRAVPPAAIRRRFPAVTLLLGLSDAETTPDKTPWWLLVLRVLTVAALIVGFAGPVLNQREEDLATGPVLIVADASWASAPVWGRHLERIDSLLTEAGRLGRPVALLSLGKDAPAGGLPFRAAQEWDAQLQPVPWEPDYGAFADWIAGQSGTFDTYWLSDGLARKDRGRLADVLAKKGSVSVVEATSAVLGLRPPVFEDGFVKLGVVRSDAGIEQTVTLGAFGPDPAGIERQLGQSDVVFEAEALDAEAVFDLPVELRNRIRRFALSGVRSAGSVALSDDALKKRKVALFAGRQAREGQELVSALHYLRKALLPTAELIEAPVGTALLSVPDVVVLADVARMTDVETKALHDWVEAGGMLVRFAGPRLAASTLVQSGEDPLLPVRLRAGGRSVGGAMSWGSPKLLSPFEEGTPFYGLAIPDEVTVSSQVLAQPDPDLADRVLAMLQDGTPLVTQKSLGAGRVVLVHVTANAEWSTLPLSGLFVQMLERLAVTTRPAPLDGADLAGHIWSPSQVMNGFGELRDGSDLAGVAGERLPDGVGPDLFPGVYENSGRQFAVNVMATDRELSPAEWGSNVTVESLEIAKVQPLKAYLLSLALCLLVLDIIATLWLSGRLSGPRSGIVATVLLGFLVVGPEARASDERAIRATNETVLAFVKTGDAKLDAVSQAGLFGLSLVLTQRTSIEPAKPMAVDPEVDELAFFPMLYWPISESQRALSEAAYEKLNTYLRTGGLILFDTRDANIGGFGTSTPNGRKLQQIAAGLDIPALEPVPADHVLTRSFYLLQDFPGRFKGRDVWVEAAPADAEQLEGTPFRNLNDGVTPVVIGGNDWASAWALTAAGRTMYPVGRGFAGERQREIAYRFGVNLVMHVLTGNYKSDQVHVPALLERLGQ